MHLLLPRLRDRLFEGYLMGAFGEYVWRDFLDTNFTSCAPVA